MLHRILIIECLLFLYNLYFYMFVDLYNIVINMVDIYQYYTNNLPTPLRYK